MIRLSMLQLRVQAITAAVALIAFAVLLAATGPHLASLYAASGLRGCQPASCGQRASSFLQQVNSTSPYATVDLLSIIIIALTPPSPACSGEPHCSPASWKPGPSPWPGASPSPGPGG